MEKSFLNLNFEQKKIYLLIFTIGMIVSVAMCVKEYNASRISNEYELYRNEAGEGAYEQELYASIDGEDKVSLKVNVAEQQFTEQEAKKVIREAIPVLMENLKGENESLESVTRNLYFMEQIPETPVEVTWGMSSSEYFFSDGTLKEDIEVREPVEVKLSAILECQGYCEEFETKITLLPIKKTIREELLALIAENDEKDKFQKTLTLPKEYQGKTIVWKKTADRDSLYFFAFTIGAAVLLRLGHERDVQQKKKRYIEQLEAEYAQIVSKMMMLLSAGLSVRNAWERIVLMEQRKTGEQRAVYKEMNWALREMQKGIPELEVYERFGERIGQIHYKKMISSIISYKRRGGTNLMEVMHQEMLEAWEERKRKARQQGEIISTKLLLPMMGMLTVVFIMILVPAFLVLQ